MSIAVLTVLVIAAALFGMVAVIALSRMNKTHAQNLQNQLGTWVQDQLRNSNEQFLQLANERLGREQLKAQSEFSQSKQQIEGSLAQMSEALDKYSRLVKEFESDRTQKYGHLQAQLENSANVISKLQQTTNQLTSVLANVKLRGQWGERVAEDILRGSGFLEGTHYLKNKAQESSSSRPDYIFLLPNETKVSMDVKFPLDNYLAFVNSESAEAREGCQAEFVRDVRDRIKEIARKDYINPDERTLDYVLLFIPNEQVFGFIQEVAPGIWDEAVKQKVILCSPFTLYAFVGVIRQAAEIFRFELRAKEILGLIQGFKQDFDTFKVRFEGLGLLLEKTRAKYDEITETSYKRLDNRLRKIDDHQRGNARLENQHEESAIESLQALPPS